MFYRIVAACFQNVVETNKIGLDISVRISNWITNACLCCQVNNCSRFVCFKNVCNGLLVCDVSLYKKPLTSRRHLFDLFQPIIFQCYIVVVVHVINTNDCNIFYIFEQTQYQIWTYESSCSCNKYCFSFQINVDHKFPLFNILSI